MLEKRTAALGVGLTLALLGGCANQQSPGFTHEWTTSQHGAAMRFHDNERDCQDSVRSVLDYEQCMQNRGYQLYQP